MIPRGLVLPIDVMLNNAPTKPLQPNATADQHITFAVTEVMASIARLMMALGVYNKAFLRRPSAKRCMRKSTPS